VHIVQRADETAGTTCHYKFNWGIILAAFQIRPMHCFECRRPRPYSFTIGIAYIDLFDILIGKPIIIDLLIRYRPSLHVIWAY